MAIPLVVVIVTRQSKLLSVYLVPHNVLGWRVYLRFPSNLLYRLIGTRTITDMLLLVSYRRNLSKTIVCLTDLCITYIHAYTLVSLEIYILILILK